jgi:uncharacterized membrane protein YeaQ/YmgE (transglycosylase-associated protein family)
MIGNIGLPTLPNEVFVTVGAFALLASLIHGWAVDTVIGEAGFGLVGNTILSLLGGMIGVWTWAVFLNQKPLFSTDVINVIMFGVAGAMIFLISLAFVRKAMTPE